MARIWKQHGEYGSAIDPSWVYHVHVCSFTFSFGSVAHIQEYLDYFSQKVHPSSADNLHGADHWERQSCFDQLPLYLFEEAKRQKIVKALTQAISEFSK